MLEFIIKSSNLVPTIKQFAYSRVVFAVNFLFSLPITPFTLKECPQ
jgi:hypothetical protein